MHGVLSGWASCPASTLGECSCHAVDHSELLASYRLGAIARYVGPDGVKHSGPHPFYDYGEARAWLNTEERLLEKGGWAPPNQRAAQKELEEMADITVGQWLQQWLEIQSHALKPSTMQNYRAVLDRRVYKAPGAAKNIQHLPLASLTRGQVMRWWDALEATYGRQQENHSALRRLSTALKAAVERELLPINPAAGLGIKRPKSERKELPTYETMRAIVDELEPRHRIIGVLTFFHGLRIGEVLALRRMDIDVTGDQAVVHVRGSAYRDNAGGGMVRLETPKTDAGVRDVPVFPEFVPMIKEHLEKFAPGVGLGGQPGFENLLGATRDHVQEARGAAAFSDGCQIQDDGDVFVAVGGVAPHVFIHANDTHAFTPCWVIDQQARPFSQDSSIGGIPGHA